MAKKRFKESDVAEIGGIFEDDLYVKGVDELVAWAAVTSKKFKEALNTGKGMKGWWNAVREIAAHRLREANSETGLGFLMRKGIQSAAMDWYNLVAPVYKDYTEHAGSNGMVEFYAPLYPSVLPDRVMRGQEYPEGRIVGEDSNILNEKFGGIESFERELFDDDQTGQIKQRSKNLGQGMGHTESIWASSRYIGAARTYQNIVVPASRYSTTNTDGTTITGPFSTSLFGATGNRPTTYGTLNIGRFTKGYVTLLNAVDPLGNKIIVNPDYLLVSSFDVVSGDLLLNSPSYPGVIGPSDYSSNPAILGGTSNVSGANLGVLGGQIGSWNSHNPFKGLGIKLCVERFFPDWAWAMGQKRGLIYQERDPLEIQQEAPNSGNSFSADVYRYKSRKRFNVEWAGGGSRFAYLGNNGDSTGTL